MEHVISDIHGCFYTLEKLIDRIERLDSSPKFIFIGDYFDRGLHSKEVLEYLLNLREKRECIFLRGNHDDVIDWILNEKSATDLSRYCSLDLGNIMYWWLRNGFRETLESYGIDFEEDIEKYVQMGEQFQKCAAQHKEFVRDLQLYYENDTHFVCHAYFSPVKKFFPILESDKETAEYTLWHRFPYEDCLTVPLMSWDKVGIFGHTPIQYYGATAPIKYDKLRLIDTGAFTGEYLCDFMIEKDNWILQASDERDVKEKYRYKHESKSTS